VQPCSWNYSNILAKSICICLLNLIYLASTHLKNSYINAIFVLLENTPKGKRRLEFQTKQPLKDKKFYLDLKGYKKISSLAARIKELGGVRYEIQLSFIDQNI
jgi:hypothetical protein